MFSTLDSKSSDWLSVPVFSDSSGPIQYVYALTFRQVPFESGEHCDHPYISVFAESSIMTLSPFLTHIHLLSMY